MIILKFPTDRSHVPVRSLMPDRATPRGGRLVARWQQDASGRLSCRWKALSKPPGNSCRSGLSCRSPPASDRAAPRYH